jgi:transposase
MRYIHLSAEEITDLSAMELSTISKPLRDRIQSLLMSHKGAKELALYFQVVPKTIYEWFNLWDSGGCVGILHKSGTGRKAKLKDIAWEVIEDLVKKHPLNLKPVLAELLEKYALSLSLKTLQRHIKKVHLAKSPQVN